MLPVEIGKPPGALSGMKMLEAATALAFLAHKDQHRTNQDTGEPLEPYVFHPIRVASALEGFDLKTVAMLHDVVEDTDWTLEDLTKHGFPARVVEAVQAITRNKPPKAPDTEPFMDYVARCALNELARKVKLADVADNSTDIKPTSGMFKRYAKAKCVLHQGAPK